MPKQVNMKDVIQAHPHADPSYHGDKLPKVHNSSVDGLCKLHDKEVYLGVEVEVEEAVVPTFNPDNHDANSSLLELLTLSKHNTPAECDASLATWMVIFHKFWKITTDNSLRGNKSVEFVLSKPLKGNQLSLALLALQQIESKLPGNALHSSRCSTHVHMNVFDLLAAEYFMTLLLYVILEPAIFNYCGVKRTDNIYSVPIYKSHHTSQLLAQAFHPLKTVLYTEEVGQVSALLDIFNNSWPKYSAINIGGNKKCKGTIEFRHFSSTSSANDLLEWINKILRIRTAAKGFVAEGKQLGDVATHFLSDPIGMAHQVFKSDYSDFMEKSTKQDLYRGARHALTIIYGLGTVVPV